MRRSLISLMFLALIAACGSDPAPNPVCTAGTTNACLCSGGSSGVQTCSSAGSGFGVCECGSPMDGGMPDSGPGPVCTAGTSQACSCTGGGTGTQTCRPDGTGYAACSCSPTTCTVTQGGAVFTDTCPASEICVCPGGASACTDGQCGGIDGRTFTFMLSGYAVPMLDSGGNCWDDILTPCDDPPEMTVGVVVSGIAYGAVTATDVPTLVPSGGTSVWAGNFDLAGFTALVGADRSYAFAWADIDPGANDPIGEDVGALPDATLRARYLNVGPADSGFIAFMIPQP